MNYKVIINLGGDSLIIIGLLIAVPIRIRELMLMASIGHILKKTYDMTFMSSNYFDFYLNSIEYKEAYSVYKIILEELSSLFQELDYDNEIKIFAGYYFLLRNGYLSLEHEFYYKEDIKTANFLYGANIMEGYDKCFNVNSMFTDLLNVSSYEAYNISMFLHGIEYKFNNDNLRMTIEKLSGVTEIMDERVSLKFIANLITLFERKYNHLATLVRNDVHSYVLDATNNTIFGIDGDKRCYQNDSYYHIGYEKECNLLKKNKLSKLLKPTTGSMDEIQKSYNSVSNSCTECIDIFEKFYLKHKCFYQEVAEKKKILLRQTERYNPLSK